MAHNDRTRKLVDGTLNGDIRLDGHDPDLVNAVRALARAVRIVADAADETDETLSVIGSRVYQLLGGIATSVAAGVILFVILNR